MSKAAVSDQVIKGCKAIEGVIDAQLGFYEPEDSIHQNTPCVGIKVRPARWQQVTGTEVLVSYVFRMRLYLAAEDVRDDELERLALPFDERFRAAFYKDRQLAGACLVTELQVAEDNLETYKLGDPAEIPYRDYVMSVTEQISKTAAADD